ncbi:MAG: DUF1877 family protein [Sphaerotilus natans]
MSLGGDFYALSDDQLQRMLDGTLDPDRFLGQDEAERPLACYAGAELVWHELQQLLSGQDALGQEMTTDIPEMSGYTWASEVPVIAADLADLDRDALTRRIERLGLTDQGPSLLEIVGEVSGFYQQAAASGSAVVFRVT